MKKIIKKIKEHKKEILVGIGIVGAVVVSALVVKKIAGGLSTTKAPFDGNIRVNNIPTSSSTGITTMGVVEESVSRSAKPIRVISHTRELVNGNKPSPEKIATASEHGFKLLKNQTWVKPHLRNVG